MHRFLHHETAITGTSNTEATMQKQQCKQNRLFRDTMSLFRRNSLRKKPTSVKYAANFPFGPNGDVKG